MSRSIKIILAIFALLVVIFLARFVSNLLSPDVEDDQAPEDIGETAIIDDFGLEKITTLPYEDVAQGQEIDVTGSRDDRIFIEPSRPDFFDSTLPSQPERSARALPRLTRLFAGHVAGYRIDQNADGTWSVKVTEMGTGSRYKINTNPYELQFISPGEVRRVIESHLFANDTVLLLHEGKDEFTVKSSFVPFDSTASDTGLQRFEDNIRVATDNENRLFFTSKVNEKTVGLVVDVENPDDTKMVWRSGFSRWIPRWGRSSFITIATPISSHARGMVYLLDPTGDHPFMRLVEPTYGGAAFVDSDSGHFVLYETGFKDFIGTTVVTDQQRENVIELPTTLPEKCDGFNGVFVCAVPEEISYQTESGHDTVFPDSWYQGDIVFTDIVLLIDVVTGEVQQVMSQDEDDIRILSGGERFDIIHPRVSDDGKLLFFVNKNNLSLWMLRLF